MKKKNHKIVIFIVITGVIFLLICLITHGVFDLQFLRDILQHIRFGISEIVKFSFTVYLYKPKTTDKKNKKLNKKIKTSKKTIKWSKIKDK